MKRTGCICLCCLMLFCAGCSFQPPDSDTSRMSSTAVSKTGKTESQPRSTPSVTRQTGEGADGMPAVIDPADVGTAGTKQKGQDGDTQTKGPYIGNIKSKVFHKADCKLVQKMKAENKQAFSVRAEAFEQGYRPCTTCRP